MVRDQKPRTQLAQGVRRKLVRVAGLSVVACLMMPVAFVGGVVLVPEAALAARIDPELAARLSPRQLQAYQQYLKSRSVFDRRLEMYWALVEERRSFRRQKYRAKQAFVASDYVAEQPPKYQGPGMPSDVAAIIDRLEKSKPQTPAARAEMDDVSDFRKYAKSFYGFVPTPTTERQFKTSYAIEALKAGLDRDQVVRVYALETGGRGTYDMQAGIDPDSKRGRVISSALGYAQLLNANSISELVKHGDDFMRRLQGMAAAPGVSANDQRALLDKVDAMQRMLKVARSVPYQWSAHQELAKTAQGSGIHALNLDADVGPWMQVLKLKALLDLAMRDPGRTSLSGAELELMNLAGPQTGLEMMQAVGRTMPTTNFFSQRGYYRNTIVRDKNGAQLLVALGERMEAGLKKPGSIEFLQVFNEVMAGQPMAMTRRAPVARRTADPAFGPETVFK